MNKFKAAQVWSSAYSPSRSLRHLHEGEGCPGSRADAPERTCSEPLAVGVPGADAQVRQRCVLPRRSPC